MNTPLRFLLVDDEEPIRDLHAQILKMSYPECTVDDCSDGDEFLPLARKAREEVKPYTLYLTDNRMMRMNGLKALEILRKEGDKVPAIMTSGTPGEIPLSAYRDLAPFYVLDKPYTATRFKELVTAVLHLNRQNPSQ
ncbi:MAG: response regulator [Nanoarchaeota archaeon]